MIGTFISDFLSGTIAPILHRTTFISGGKKSKPPFTTINGAVHTARWPRPPFGPSNGDGALKCVYLDPQVRPCAELLLMRPLCTAQKRRSHHEHLEGTVTPYIQTPALFNPWIRLVSRPHPNIEARLKKIEMNCSRTLHRWPNRTGHSFRGLGLLMETKRFFCNWVQDSKV